MPKDLNVASFTQALLDDFASDLSDLDIPEDELTIAKAATLASRHKNVESKIICKEPKDVEHYKNMLKGIFVVPDPMDHAVFNPKTNAVEFPNGSIITVVLEG